MSDQIPLTRLTSYQSQTHGVSHDTVHSHLDNDDQLDDRDASQNGGAHQNKAHIALRASRNIPLIQWLTHGASIFFTTALLSLCAHNVYFADITRPNVNSVLNAFQFIARIHEVIVSASVTMMVVHQLRYELCNSAGVPLGYLTSAFSLAQPQMLFTYEFWAATTTHTGVRRKYWFSGMIVFGTVLIALSGPSSAILMIPQLDWWDLKNPFTSSSGDGYTWINSTWEQHWPPRIDDTFVATDCNPRDLRVKASCSYASRIDLATWAWDYIKQNSAPNITIKSDAGMVRYLTASNTTAQGDAGYAVATTGMSGLTRNLGAMWLYAQRNDVKMARPGRPLLSLQTRNLDQPLLKPLVQTQCAHPVYMKNQTTVGVEFPTSELIGKNGKPVTISKITRTIDVDYFEDGHPSLNYVDLSRQAGRPLIGAYVSIIFANATLVFPDLDHDGNNEARAVMACTFLSNWIPTTMSRDAKTESVLLVDNPNPADIVTSPDLMSQARDLEVDLSWTESTNPLMGGGYRQTVMEYQLVWLAFSQPYYDGAWATRWPWLIASMLSMTWAEGLARINHYTPLYVVEGDVQTHSEFSAWGMGYFRDADSSWSRSANGSIAEFIEASPDLYFPVTWSVRRYGYAWSFERVTKYLAASVLLLHVVFIVVYLCLVFMRNWRCDSWSTLTKLMVLAIQSPPSNVLKGASTNIDDHSTYADVVRIRESRDRDGGSAVLTVTSRKALHGASLASDQEDYSSVHSKEGAKLRIGKKYS